MPKNQVGSSAAVLEREAQMENELQMNNEEIPEDTFNKMKAFTDDYMQKLKEETIAETKNLSYEEKLKRERLIEATIKAFA